MNQAPEFIKTRAVFVSSNRSAALLPLHIHNLVKYEDVYKECCKDGVLLSQWVLKATVSQFNELFLEKKNFILIFLSEYKSTL